MIRPQSTLREPLQNTNFTISSGFRESGKGFHILVSKGLRKGTLGSDFFFGLVQDSSWENLTENEHLQRWFIYPDTLVSGRYFRINEFSGLLNRPLVRTWKSVPTLFVRTSEISGLSKPGLTNHHCIPLFPFMYMCTSSEMQNSLDTTLSLTPAVGVQ